MWCDALRCIVTNLHFLVLINKLYTLIWYAIVIIINDCGSGGGGRMQIQNWCLLIDKNHIDFNGQFFFVPCFIRPSLPATFDPLFIVCSRFVWILTIIFLFAMIFKCEIEKSTQIKICCNLSMCYVSINDWHEYGFHSENNGIG